VCTYVHTVWHSSLQLPLMPGHEDPLPSCKAASLEHSWRRNSCKCYCQTEVTDRQINPWDNHKIQWQLSWHHNRSTVNSQRNIPSWLHSTTHFSMDWNLQMNHINMFYYTVLVRITPSVCKDTTGIMQKATIYSLWHLLMKNYVIQLRPHKQGGQRMHNITLQQPA
jgi:hypothetical protein